MTITILLFQSPTCEKSNYEEFFKPLDENNELVQKAIIASKDKIRINKVFSSPYWSSIQMSLNILDNFNTEETQFSIENSLYDVLDKTKYKIHKSNYYLSQHYTESKEVYSQEHEKRIKHSFPDVTERSFRSKIISKNVNSYYKSTRMVSNIRYGEDEQDIINRIGPFLFNIFNKMYEENNKESNYTMILVTHSSLIDYIVKYVKKYNKGLEDERVIIKGLKKTLNVEWVEY